MVESKEERAKVNEYRKELSKIDEWVGERDELIYRFKELKGVKGKQERTEINARINALNDAIARHDSKLLKIATANGSSFAYKNKEDAEPTGSDITLKEKSTGSDIGSASNNIIPTSGEKINPKGEKTSKIHFPKQTATVE